jgi:anti-sigma-K factor RskA
LEKQTEAERQKFNTLYADVQLIQDSSVIVVKMKGVAGKENSFATVYWNTRTSDLYLHQNRLPAPPPGKQYQLWAIMDGKPVDAGMLTSCTTLCKLKNINAAQAFAITLEKEGGSPVPTMSEMYVLGKI